GDERGVVAAVAFEARGRSALRPELVEGTREGEQRVGGRRVAELPVPVVAPELAAAVEAEGAAPALGGLEIRAPREDEGEAGNALDALVRRRDEVVDARADGIDRDRAEAAHGVHDEDAAVVADDFAERLDGIEDAGGRLAVDDDHMRD